MRGLYMHVDHRRWVMRTPQGLLLLVLTGVLWAAGVEAEPQRVRLPEGNAHGFLVIGPTGGNVR